MTLEFEVHIGENLARQIVRLFLNNGRHMIVHVMKEVADQTAHFTFSGVSSPESRPFSASNARHERQWTDTKDDVAVAERSHPAPEIAEKLVQLGVQSPSPFAPPQCHLHLEDHIDDLAEDPVESSDRLRRIRFAQRCRAGAGDRHQEALTAPLRDAPDLRATASARWLRARPARSERSDGRNSRRDRPLKEGFDKGCLTTSGARNALRTLVGEGNLTLVCAENPIRRYYAANSYS
jgi:hypothetical protein